MSNKKNFLKVFPVKKSPKVKTVRNATSDYSGVIEESKGFGLIDAAGRTKYIAPEHCQRPESWDDEDRKYCFESILMDRMEGNLIFINLKVAISKLKDLAPDDPALEEFEKYVEQGYRYIVLDGHNRISFLTGLITNQYKLPRGSYTYVCDDEVKTLTIGSNTYFSDLKENVQELILERELVISEYTQINGKGMRDVFLAANAGCSPNDQERRNVEYTSWAPWIRSIRHNNNDLCIKAAGKNHKYRLKGDQFLTATINLALRLKFIEEGEKVPTVTQSTMNKMYSGDFLTEDQKESFEANFNLLDNWMDRLRKEEGIDDKMLTASTMQNLYWMMTNGLTEYEDAVVAVKMHTKAKTMTKYINREGNNFAWACGSTSAKHNQMRLKVFSDIFDRLEIEKEGGVA